MTDIIVEIGKAWFENEIILCNSHCNYIFSFKIGFIKILLWLLNKIL